MKSLENRCYCKEELTNRLFLSKIEGDTYISTTRQLHYTEYEIQFIGSSKFFCVGGTTSQFKTGGPEGQPVRLQRITRENDFTSNH